MDEIEVQYIRRCQEGHTEEFGSLYDRYIRKIYDFIYFKTMHRETAEDLTSQTFMKAFQNIQSFREGAGTFSAWLYRIARNTVIDHYRTRKETRSLEDAWDLGADDETPRDIDTRDRLAKVHDAVQKLPAQQRDIIMLRVWSELSFKEIAAVVGKSEASCKMAFSRSLAKLRTEHFVAYMLLCGILIRYSG
ncbi:MAG: sigma-70 family RNA polymerase sigma factor [Patescibacteria group bacterium]